MGQVSFVKLEMLVACALLARENDERLLSWEVVDGQLTAVRI
jgi:hypothetical protein